MTNPDEGWTLDAVMRELHGDSLGSVRSVEERMSHFIQQTGTRACHTLTRSVRDAVAGGTHSPPRDELIRRCAPDGQRRIAMLLDQERMQEREEGRPNGANCLCAGFLGVTLLERELDRLLAEPVRPLAGELADAQEHHKKKYKTEGLRAWGDGKVPTTLGLVEQVTLGLRWGLGQGRNSLTEFLQDRFEPQYQDLVTEKSFALTIHEVREDFRNPICHGKLTFLSVEEYQRLARLLSGRDGFRHWRDAPPEHPPAPASRALLHHHLRYSLLAAKQASASVQTSQPVPPGATVDESQRHRLLNLRPPIGDDWDFGFWLCPRDVVPVQARSIRSVTRDLGEAPASTPRFHSGQQMCLGFHTRRPGHVTVVDFGTSGRIWGLCPSNACRDNYLPVGESFLPPAYDRWPAFHLTGNPGVERVVAIVTAEPLNLDWRPDELDRPCREVNDADLTLLLDYIATLPDSSWSMAACSFELFA